MSIYEVRSFLRDSSTVTLMVLKLFPAHAVCCFMSVRPRFGLVEYFHMPIEPLSPAYTDPQA